MHFNHCAQKCIGDLSRFYERWSDVANLLLPTWLYIAGVFYFDFAHRAFPKSLAWYEALHRRTLVLFVV